jgi:predicted P-loop ATPase
MATKTKTKTKTDEAPREHKKPWQETFATPEEIKAMVSNHVLLRYNEVRGLTEVHWLSEGPVIQEDEQGLLSIFGEEGGVTDGYTTLTDRDINTLWEKLYAEKRTNKQYLRDIIDSEFVPSYHPFRHYLEHLPPWKEEDGDAIMGLSLTVNVKGGSDEQILFYRCLKKWLVAMVASWLDPKVINHEMLVLIGKQGAYKTTWFSHLLPPQIREYFYTKTNSDMISKDDLLVLAQYGLVCWEELDSMQSKELNKLKAAMTMPSINVRAPFERYPKNRPHVASFCGTGNNVQFLSDTTGTRRWLPFEVESIESPLTTPFDYDGIFSQAYALYQQGFQYWFSSEEISQLTQHNRQFETSQSANELIDEHFRKPVGIEGGDFLPASVILQMSGGVNMRELSAAALGRALTAMGFESKLIHGVRRYRVVRRTEAEKEMHRHLQEMGGEGGEVE